MAARIVHPMPQEKAQQLLAGTASITALWGRGDPTAPLVARA